MSSPKSRRALLGGVAFIVIAVGLAFWGVNSRARALALLDSLFVNPYVTASRAARELGVTAPTAREAIRVLEAHGILQRASERAWRRLYVAKPILDVIEQPFDEGISVIE